MRRRDVAGSVRASTIIVIVAGVMLALVLLVLMAYLLFFLLPDPYHKRIDVTLLNKSGMPIETYLNSGEFSPVMRPQETKRFREFSNLLRGVYPGGPSVPPPNYKITAKVFVPGKGNLFGWEEEDGTRVTGGGGQLIFCVTYTWEELQAMNFTITITRNVFPGYQPPDCSP